MSADAQGTAEPDNGVSGGRGAASSIEAPGTQVAGEQALRVLKAGGTLSSLGGDSDELSIAMTHFATCDRLANQRDRVLKVAVKP